MTKTIVLSDSTLSRLPAGVARPGYDRGRLEPGILHFGVGNFHRAHMAVYLDDLFAKGRNQDFAIVGTGVMPSDAAILEALAEQDYLTTIVEQEADRTTARVIGPMIDGIAPGDTDRILATMADPAIRIVSLTITEGGYFIDPATGRFDPSSPAIVADARDPSRSRTVFGLIVAGLAARRRSGTAPFTVVSCDNLPHNGAVTCDAVAGLAELADPELAAWIRSTVAFPNGMVDRITPATGERERRAVAEDFGVADRAPVFCEAFKQWVLEDRFPAGRPALETVGVQFVPDVDPYETMKIRILNGGHAVIAYPGGLLDLHFVHEAMEHSLIRRFLEKVERDEIVPVVPPVPDTSLEDYVRLIARRFANPKIGDTVRRLCLDGSNRQPKFIIPSIADRLARGLEVDGLALVSAFWCRYCFGVSESGAVIEPNDPNWDRLTERSRRARESPKEWLAMADIYGSVGQDETFRARFADWLRTVWADGTAAALRRYLASGDGG